MNRGLMLRHMMQEIIRAGGFVCQEPGDGAPIDGKRRAGVIDSGVQDRSQQPKNVGGGGQGADHDHLQMSMPHVVDRFDAQR